MQQAPFHKVAKLLSNTPSTTTSDRKANFTISVIGVNKTYRIFQEKSGLRTTIIRAFPAVEIQASLRGIARVKGVKPDTVLHWLEIAGKQVVTVSSQLIHNLHLSQAQIDELWTFVKKSPATLAHTKRQQAREIIGSGRR